MKIKRYSNGIFQIAFIVAAFWILDVVFHMMGAGESNYYYLSKLVNSILFASLWVLAFKSGKSWKKAVYSFVFGTWISFYYLISSYSGLVQWLGIYARYTPPPFVIGSIVLGPFVWWVFHSLVFYLGLEFVQLLDKNKRD